MPRSASSLKGLRAKKRAIVHAVKDQPCADCGRSFPPEAMDFDHVRGVKRSKVSFLINSSHSIDTLIREIALCDVVCACCHRIRTHAPTRH